MLPSTTLWANSGLRAPSLAESLIHTLSMLHRGGSRGRVQGVRTPSPEMTCSFLIQLVFCEKKNHYVVYWC